MGMRFEVGQPTEEESTKLYLKQEGDTVFLKASRGEVQESIMYFGNGCGCRMYITDRAAAKLKIDTNERGFIIMNGIDE